MALAQFTKDMNIVSALADEPTQTAAELKAKFDEGGAAVKAYINETLKPFADALESAVPDVSGGVSAILSADLSASRALVSNSLGKVAASDVTSVELGYLDGAASNIQTQLDAKQKAITCGTAAPSGGADGDIYIQYA